MDAKDAIRLTLIDLMDENKVSGKDLADAVGVSKQAVSAWRSGRSSIDVDNIPAICRFFGISVNEFFGAEPIETSLRSVKLSQDEKELLDVYRQVEPWERELILNHAKMVLLHAKHE